MNWGNYEKPGGRQERLQRPQHLILLSCLIAFAGCGDEQDDDISAAAGMTASQDSGGQMARGESNLVDMTGSAGIGVAGGAIDTFLGGRTAGDSPSVPEAEAGGTPVAQRATWQVAEISVAWSSNLAVASPTTKFLTANPSETKPRHFR